MKPLTLLLLVASLASQAAAWIRPQFEDDEVVARSEAIVAGGIKEGSVRRVEHAKPPGEGRSWEHHATLVVKRVLKGNVAEKEIPIVFHYGLDPIVDPATGAIRIADNGGKSTMELAGGDARGENLWFLRRRSGV